MGSPKDNWRLGFNFKEGGRCFSHTSLTEFRPVFPSFDEIMPSSPNRIWSFPQKIYPTQDDLPVHRTEVPIWP